MQKIFSYFDEDAAHAIYSKYGDKYLGTFGDFGILSFHQTKNIFCGEGGALLVNKKNTLRDLISSEIKERIEELL